jgi:hypothetical protein
MADNTSLAEAAQALFCALADYVLIKSGKNKLSQIFNFDNIPTYQAFEIVWNGEFEESIKSIYDKHTDTSSVSLAKIQDFLKKNVTWYQSSISIAKKLVEDIDKVIAGFKGIKKPKSTEIWFVRGDDDIMKNIQELFKKANNTQKGLNKTEDVGQKGTIFGDINKWSPADIYFATDQARAEIKKKLKDNPNKTGLTFDRLNELIADLILSGQLLPLSLKKTTKEVILQKVNFERDTEMEQIKKYAYNGTSNWKPYKKGSKETRDMKIFFNPSSPKDYIKVKHDVSTASFKCDVVYAGAEARAGSIGSINIFSSLVDLVDPSFAKSIKSTFDKGNKAFKEELEKYEKKIGGKPEPTKKGKKPTPLRASYDLERGEISALNVINNIMPPIKKWLNKDQEKSDNFIHIIYQYATSRTEDSGKFVIAK